MKREKKETLVKGLDKSFAENNTYYLVDFKQMPVSQSVELRKILRRNSYSFKVVKNRLALRALSGRCPDELKGYFRKPTAIAFASENPLGLARLLKDFSGQNKVLSIKAGVLEGHYLASTQFEEVVKIQSREELLGKIGYFMAYPLTQFLRTWQAPLVNTGRLLSQLRIKKEG